MKLVLFANRLWILHKDNATSAWHRRSWQLVAGMSTSSETRCGRTLCICLYTLFIMISHCIFYAMYCYIHIYIYIMYIFIHLYIIYMYMRYDIFGQDCLFINGSSLSKVPILPRRANVFHTWTCSAKFDWRTRFWQIKLTSTKWWQGSMGPLAKVIQRCSKRW